MKGGNVTKILLVSHGRLALGCCEAAKMILGDSADIDYVCLMPDSDIGEFRQHVYTKLNSYTDTENIIAICDMQGGSPYNTLIEALDLDKSYILTGMSLPLVLQIALEKTITKERVIAIVEKAKEALSLYEHIETSEGDESL